MRKSAQDIRLNFLNHLGPLSEWIQRSICFGTDISRCSPENASLFFSDIVRDVAKNRDYDSTILAQSAFLSLLYGHWKYEHIIHTREAAAGQEEGLTLTFLVPPEFPTEDDSDAEIPDYDSERTLTLGERRSFASVPSRKTIELAMKDPHPMVAEKLLENPKTTEADIVRVAASRKMPPSALVRIALHMKWRKRNSVRKALINNRVLPESFGLSLVPFLDGKTLREIAFDNRLNQTIREAASSILDEII